MDVASRRKLDDVILRTKFSSLRWTTDNRGVFYTTYAGALESGKDTVPKQDEKATEDAKKNKEVHFFASFDRLYWTLMCFSCRRATKCHRLRSK